MELAESDLLFIDVDASMPVVKQESDEVTDHDSNRSRFPSAAQLKVLLERLEKNPDLARGSLRTRPDRQRARRFWEQIRLRLNTMEGTRKSSNQWMKYWTDKKMFVKKKAAQAEFPLSEIEETIYYLGGGGTYRKSACRDAVVTRSTNLRAPDRLSDPISADSTDTIKCTSIRPFKCELCPYSSVSKKYAKKHQEKHKSCACGFLSRNAVELKRHVAKCGEKVAKSGENAAKSGENIAESGVNVAESSGNPAETHFCPICQREYVDNKGLAKHTANSAACPLCALRCCAGSLRAHMLLAHAGAAAPPNNKCRFQCALCEWSSSVQQKILLHLIHHPAQVVDPHHVDVTVLKKYAILPAS